MKVLSTRIAEVKLPNGETKTIEELANSHDFGFMKVPCVLEIDAGIMHFVQPLHSIAFENGIEGDDPEEIFDKYLEKLEQNKEQAAREQSDFQTLQAQVDLHEEVINELMMMQM